jgi:hypothetical protein
MPRDNRQLEPNEHLDTLSAATGAQYALTLHRGFDRPRTWEGGYEVKRLVEDGFNSDGDPAHRDLVKLTVLSRTPEGKYIDMPGAGPHGKELEVDGVFRSEDITIRRINRVSDV